MIEGSEFTLVQRDGAAPFIVASGSAAGESGVSILSARFQDGAHFRATPRQHLVWFHASPQVRIECRIAGRVLTHRPPAGSLAICPAGAESAADVEGSIDTIVVMVDPGRLSLAAAEQAALEAQLNERLSGHDQPLLDLAAAMARESADGYTNGPLFWNELAGGFVAQLVARYTSAGRSPPRGRGLLGEDVLRRLNDYVSVHLDKPIEVEALAGIAGRSPFHFSRVFTRSVGTTPHRYVVHLRLRRAVELVREGHSSLAEIAACTGFADQSHLSRWAKRVHGVSLKQLAA